jgi:hypothetical protein
MILPPTLPEPALVVAAPDREFSQIPTFYGESYFWVTAINPVAAEIPRYHGVTNVIPGT